MSARELPAGTLGGRPGNHGGCSERSGAARREPRGQMVARSSLLRRPTPGARPARRTSSVVAALAALAPRLVRLAHHDYPDRLLEVPAAADALGVVRLGAAALLPGALVCPACRWLPAALFAVAAGTDFFDGVLARRGGGPTRHGAVLDNLADIAFVLAGTITGAALGLVPSAVPAAIALAFAAYLLASLGGGRAARSPLGHAAGVLNYALTGAIAGAVAVPGHLAAVVLETGSLIVVGVNLAAVLARLLPGRTPG